MEYYKSTCPDCKAVYFWTGYKTGMGKTPEQLEAMSRRQKVCRNCDGENLKTELDRETPEGKGMDEIYKHIAGRIGGIISEKLDGTDDSDNPKS